MIALLAAGIALVAASARAQTTQVVLASSVFASRDVPANAITAFGVSCPRGYVSTSAGLTSPGTGTTVLAITPVLSGYRFRIGNPVANDDQRVTVVVACRKVVAGGRRFVLRLRPLATKYVVVPPRKTAAAALVCPRGTTPARGGADLDPTRQTSAGAYRGGLLLSLRRQTATLERLLFAVRNRGTKARTVALYGSCLTLLRVAGAPTERLHVNALTFRVPVHSGAQTLTRRCARGWFALSAGYSLRSSLTTATGAAAVNGGGRWSLASEAEADTKADLQLACARLAP